MSGTCEVPKSIYGKRKVEPAEEKDGIGTDIHSKEDIEKIIDALNNSPLIINTTKFRLNTESNPWTIEVLDKDGNIIIKVPKEVIKEFYNDLADSQNAIYDKGLFLDTEV